MLQIWIAMLLTLGSTGTITCIFSSQTDTLDLNFSLKNFPEFANTQLFYIQMSGLEVLFFENNQIQVTGSQSDSSTFQINSKTGVAKMTSYTYSDQILISLKNFNGPLYGFSITIEFIVRDQSDYSILLTQTETFVKRPISINTNISIESLEAFTLTNFLFSYYHSIKFDQNTKIYVEFPLMNTFQPNALIYHIDNNKLKCQSISPLMSDIECNVQGNKLEIYKTSSTTVPIKQIFTFKIEGFRNNYITTQIDVTFKVCDYRIENIMILSTGSFLINKQLELQSDISLESPTVGRLTEMKFILNVISFINQQATLKIHTQLSKNQILTAYCIKNCQTEILNYQNIDQLITLQIIPLTPFYNQQLIIGFSINNSQYPSSHSISYILSEYIDTQEFIICHGRSTLEFKEGLISLNKAFFTSQFVNQQSIFSINFTLETKVPSSSKLCISYPETLLYVAEQLNNQNLIISSQNAICLFQLFDSQNLNFNLEIKNFINPQKAQLFQSFNFVVYFQNISIMKLSEPILLSFVYGQLYVEEIIMGTLSFQLTTSIQFKIKYDTYVSSNNIQILFPERDVDLSESIENLKCQIQEKEFQCTQQGQTIIISDDNSFQITNQEITIYIINIPYPRIQQELSFIQIQQGKNNEIHLKNTQIPSTLVTQVRQFFAFTIEHRGDVMTLYFTPSLNIKTGDSIVLKFEFVPLPLRDSVISCELNAIKATSCLINSKSLILIVDSVMKFQEQQVLKIFNIQKATSGKWNYQLISLAAQGSGLMQRSFYTLRENTIITQVPFYYFEVSSQSHIYNQQTLYTVSFINQIVIPSHGKLSLSVPNEIDFSNISCSEQNFPHRCCIEINQNLSTFIVFQIFDDMPQDKEYNFELKLVKNPKYTNETNKQYVFQLESTDDQGQSLQLSEFVLGQQFYCDDNCLQCEIENQCQWCNLGYFKYKGMCLAECPDGTINIENNCQTCNTLNSCEKCSKLDTSKCIQCINGYTLIDGQCIWFKIQPDSSNDLKHPEKQISPQLNENQQGWVLLDITFLVLLTLIYIVAFLRYQIYKRKNFSSFLLVTFALIDFFLDKFIFFKYLIENKENEFLLQLLYQILCLGYIIYSSIKLKLYLEAWFQYQEFLRHNTLARILKQIIIFDWRIIHIHNCSINQQIFFNLTFFTDAKFNNLEFNLLWQRCAIQNNFQILVLVLTTFINQKGESIFIYEVISYYCFAQIIQVYKFVKLMQICRRNNNYLMHTSIFETQREADQQQTRNTKIFPIHNENQTLKTQLGVETQNKQ